jgi:hypothetical protein
MARTTAVDVKQIIDTDLEDSIVEGYISAATSTVDEVLGADPSLSGDLKTEIERWFTAHLIASTREQQLSEAKAGPASAKFQGKTGMGLDATLYGQQVKAMDTTGKFAALSGKRASMTAVTSFE